MSSPRIPGSAPGSGPRRILFLDVDGVLNSVPFLQTVSNRDSIIFGDDDPAPMLDPVLVDRLNQIIQQLDVRIVLSSSWRHGWPLGVIQRALVKHGFLGRLMDKTPDVAGGRANEIRRWLDTQYPPADRFVILDDMPDAGVGMSAHFVQTDTHVGLTDEHVERARRILR